MRVIFGQISPGYKYPLSKKGLIPLRESGIVPEGIWERIQCIRFGCNTKTTQEGRTVQRGKTFEVRVNFCLWNFQTRLLSKNKSYLGFIARFGGKINREAGTITWNVEAAKRYALFILLHEIGHVVYCEQFSNGVIKGQRGDRTEEQWCDNFALRGLKTLAVNRGYPPT